MPGPPSGPSLETFARSPSVLQKKDTQGRIRGEERSKGREGVD